MISVIGDRDDVAAGDSGYRGFWFDLPDGPTLGQALLALFDERCAPRMHAPWTVTLLTDPARVIRDELGRVQNIHYDWKGTVVAALINDSCVLLHRQWELRTPLADTGHRLASGDYGFYLSYNALGGPYTVDALRAAVS